MVDWYSAVTIASTLNVTKRWVNKIATDQSWPSRARKGRGGGREYSILGLPEDIRQVILLRTDVSDPAHAPVAPVPGPTKVSTGAFYTIPAAPKPQWDLLSDGQRAAAQAKAAIIAYVGELRASGMSIDQAAEAIAVSAAAGTLPDQLSALLAKSRDPRGRKGKHVLSTRSIKRWMAAQRATAASAPPSELAPRIPQPTFRIPEWAGALLAAYRLPQKPHLAEALRQIEEQTGAVIGYQQAKRFLGKLGAIEKLRGRLGARELRKVKPFTRRTTDGLWPMDIVLPDGHTFDAEVRHPVHGQPFRPEVTTYVDIATRRIVGWSAGLAESQHAILDAMRRMVNSYGVPCIHYSDRGAYKGQLFADAVTGILPRLGVEQCFSIAYNSQARGTIERLHQTVWVALARQLPTYVGRGMDPEAKKIAFRDARAGGRRLIAWEDFLAAAQSAVNTYNAAPHRGIGGASPDEAWERAAAEGWQPVMLGDDDLDDLMPQLVRKVQRCEVSLPWGRYFATDLTEWNGSDVRVGFDVLDGSRVTVRDLEGRLICRATRDGNAKPYMPQTYVEHARAKREAGRVARLERKVDEARAEGQGVIELPPPAPQVILDEATCKEHLQVQVPAPQVIQLRPPEEILAEIQPPRRGLPIMRTEGDRIACWSELHARARAGETLADDEQRFYNAYSTEEVIQQKLEMEAEFEALTARRRA